MCGLKILLVGLWAVGVMVTACGDIRSTRRSVTPPPKVTQASKTKKKKTSYSDVPGSEGTSKRNREGLPPDPVVRSWAERNGVSWPEEGEGGTELEASAAPDLAPTSLTFSYEGLACGEEVNQSFIIKEQKFSLQHAATEVYALKHRNLRYHSFAVLLGGALIRSQASFRARVLIGGQWYAPHAHVFQDFMALKGFGGLEPGSPLKWQPWATIEEQEIPLTYPVGEQQRTLTYQARFDLAAHGACAGYYVNEQGQAFSGGAVVLILPESSDTGFYTKNPYNPIES